MDSGIGRKPLNCRVKFVSFHKSSTSSAGLFEEIYPQGEGDSLRFR